MPGLTTLDTRSNGTQSPKSPSLRIKFNHTCHRIQPHPVSNPATLGTEFTLTRHQIQPHSTKGNHTWYQCRPRCTRKSTTPADRPSHAQPHIQAHKASNPTSRHQIPPYDTKSHLMTPNPTSLTLEHFTHTASSPWANLKISTRLQFVSGRHTYSQTPGLKSFLKNPLSGSVPLRATPFIPMTFD